MFISRRLTLRRKLTERRSSIEFFSRIGTAPSENNSFVYSEQNIRLAHLGSVDSVRATDLRGRRVCHWRTSCCGSLSPLITCFGIPADGELEAAWEQGLVAS